MEIFIPKMKSSFILSWLLLIQDTRRYSRKRSSIQPWFSVVLAAEHDIKRLTVAVDWNLMQHVQSLFEFFLGTLKTIKQPVISIVHSSNKTTGFAVFRMKNSFVIHRIFEYD